MATKSALQRKGILGLAQLQAFDCWNNVCERTMMKTIEGKRNNFGVIFFCQNSETDQKRYGSN